MVRFRHWRRQRPFGAGLLLVASGLELFLSANMDLNGIEVHLGPQGFLSYLLPVLLLVCGVLSWFSPAQRQFYGIIALLTALYTFVGLNLGGFILGMLLGIIGGALVIAWGPPRPPRPASPATPSASDSAPPISTFAASSGTTAAASSGTTAAASPAEDVVPGMRHSDDAEGRWSGGSSRALAVVFVALAVTASMLVAGSRTPAGAAKCPKGLPSRSTAATAPPTAAPTRPRPPVRKTPQPAPTSSAPADEDDDTGNPILDGIADFFDGIGDLLGIPGRTALIPTPTPSDTPSRTPASASPSSAAAPRPTVSGSPIPCLGPRVFGKVAGADDIPLVSAKPGLMEVDSLTMYNSSYDGVVDMPTRTGSFKALKFSMDKAVNKPFSLTMDEAGRARTVISSNALTTEGAVRFYTPEFKGKLFGRIPVTFTPAQPPPLTLPVLWFTDVTIKLAYVRCDVLTADPMKLTEDLDG